MDRKEQVKNRLNNIEKSRATHELDIIPIYPEENKCGPLEFSGTLERNATLDRIGADKIKIIEKDTLLREYKGQSIWDIWGRLSKMFHRPKRIKRKIRRKW